MIPNCTCISHSMQMSKRLEEARAKHASAEEQVRERHRRQITELNQGHTQEMQDQLRRYQDDLRRQEDKWRVQQQAYEDRYGLSF